MLYLSDFYFVFTFKTDKLWNYIFQPNLNINAAILTNMASGLYPVYDNSKFYTTGLVNLEKMVWPLSN